MTRSIYYTVIISSVVVSFFPPLVFPSLLSRLSNRCCERLLIIVLRLLKASSSCFRFLKINRLNESRSNNVKISFFTPENISLSITILASLMTTRNSSVNQEGRFTKYSALAGFINVLKIFFAIHKFSASRFFLFFGVKNKSF